MPIQLDGEIAEHINNAFTNRVPCILATASPDGTPRTRIVLPLPGSP
jgi:hypothetical protein